MVTHSLDAEIMWNNITSNLSGDYIEILRMRVEGYSNREIAKNCNLKVMEINNIMEQIRETVSNMQLV